MAEQNQSRTSVQRDLSPRQREVLDFIINFLEENGYPPTVRRIGEKLGITSTATVSFHLDALVAKNYIKKDPKVFRGIKVLRGPDQLKVSIRIVGEIAAGAPIFAQEQYGESLEIDRSKLSVIGDNLFALKVRGDSMIKENIFDGDFAIISSQPTAENGDIVIALLGDEATLKKFHKLDSYIALLPANPSYPPIIIREEENLIIQGKMIAKISPAEATLKFPDNATTNNHPTKKV